MPFSHSGEERRDFLRISYENPVQYKPLNEKGVSRLMDAVSKNLSASGILFKSKTLPKLSSLLTLKLDYKTANICREIEDNALIVKNRLFGKVVRIEDVDSGFYNVGVAFIKKMDTLAESIKKNVSS